MGSIGVFDWSVWVMYFALIFLLLFFYRSTKSESFYKYFLTAFGIKVFGGVVFALIYVYYYGFGDTFLYFRGSTILADTLTTNFGDFIQLIFSEGGSLSPELYQYSNSIQYSNASEEWFMIKLLTPLTFVSFHSYLTTTLLMSTISFFGSWKLFKVLRDVLPNYDKLTFFAAFLIPSTLVWGGGIMKDTFTLFGINLLIYCIYFTLFKKKFKPLLIVGILVFSVLIFWLKAYIVLAFIPAILLGFNSIIRKRVESPFFKNILGSFILVLIVGVLLILPNVLSNYSKKYQVDQLQSRVQGFHSWHTDLGGSSYSLGEVEYTLTGVLSKIPGALNVTFFRPYIWEANSPIVLVAALESIGFLILTLFALFRLRLKLKKVISEKPILVTFFVYILLFGFVVGFTSYNFGALGRYKIPIFSLFAFLVFYLTVKSNAKWPSKYKDG